MGGRGASSGVQYKKDGQLFKYGDEYGSLYEFENVKFVYNKVRPTATAPIETMTPGRVYVTLAKEQDEKTGKYKLGKPKYITFFDEKKRVLQYDIDGHLHKINKKKIRKYPEGSLNNSHSHTGYDHNKKSLQMLNKEQRSYVAKIMMEWRRNVRNKPNPFS